MDGESRYRSLRILPSSLVSVTIQLLLGVGLYYSVLVFNLGVTFWIGESFMGMSGLLMHLPVIALLVFRLAGPRGVFPSSPHYS